MYRTRYYRYRYGPLAAAVAVLWTAVIGCCSPHSCPTELSRWPRRVSTYATVAARPTTGAYNSRRHSCPRRPVVRRAAPDAEFEVRRRPQFTARLADLTEEMDAEATNVTANNEKTSAGAQCRKIRYTTRTPSTKRWTPKIKKCFTFAQSTSPPQQSTAATSTKKTRTTKATTKVTTKATTKATAYTDADTAADPAADTTADTAADTTAGDADDTTTSRKKKKRKKTTVTTIAATTTTASAAPEDSKTLGFTVVEEESSTADEGDDATSADDRGDTEAADWDAKTTADGGDAPRAIANDADNVTTRTKIKNTTRYRPRKTRRTTPDYY